VRTVRQAAAVPELPVPTQPADTGAAWTTSTTERARRPSGLDRVGRRRPPGAVWAWAAVFVGSAALLAGHAVDGLDAVAAADRRLQGALNGPGWTVQLASDLAEMATPLGFRVLWMPTVILLVWATRWRALLVHTGIVWTMATLAVLAAGDAAVAREVRNRVIGSPDELVLPAWPVLVLAAISVATLYALTPSGPARRTGWALTVILLAVAVTARVVLGLSALSTSLLSALAGASAAALLFVMLVPEQHFPVRYRRQVKAHLRLDAKRVELVRTAVREQLGLELAALEPYRLDGSAGSTPCRLQIAGGDSDVVFGKLYSLTHLRSDRWYKLARVLRYGRLEDEAPFATVRRLVEHEDYMLRLLRDSGVRVPEPIGVVEVVPGREYLLVTELIPGAVEILDLGPGEVPDAVLDDALEQVHRLRVAGAAHRDVKPSNVLVQGNRVVLVDVSFGELRPSWWRVAVDLSNMLLVLALLAGPARTLARARRVFSDGELAEAMAAAGSVTVPRQLRRRVEDSGCDLLAELRRLLPPHPGIRVQRWSARRVGLAVATVAGAALAAAVLWTNLRAGGLL
jgi:tRNA A-37 threonylcarbamoyl transferase component Bud32